MILDQFCLKGKIALVTGANDGIGQAIAVGLAEAGADIAAVYRSDITKHRSWLRPWAAASLRCGRICPKWNRWKRFTAR